MLTLTDGILSKTKVIDDVDVSNQAYWMKFRTVMHAMPNEYLDMKYNAIFEFEGDDCDYLWFRIKGRGIMDSFRFWINTNTTINATWKTLDYDSDMVYKEYLQMYADAGREVIADCDDEFVLQDSYTAYAVKSMEIDTIIGVHLSAEYDADECNSGFVLNVTVYCGSDVSTFPLLDYDRTDTSDVLIACIGMITVAGICLCLFLKRKIGIKPKKIKRKVESNKWNGCIGW